MSNKIVIDLDKFNNTGKKFIELKKEICAQLSRIEIFYSTSIPPDNKERKFPLNLESGCLLSSNSSLNDEVISEIKYSKE